MFKAYNLKKYQYSCNYAQLVDLYGLSDKEAAFALAYRNCDGDAEAARQELWQNHRLVVSPSILEGVLDKMSSNPRRWRLRRRLLLEKYLRE